MYLFYRKFEQFALQIEFINKKESVINIEKRGIFVLKYKKNLFYYSLSNWIRFMYYQVESSCSKNVITYLENSETDPINQVISFKYPIIYWNSQKNRKFSFAKYTKLQITCVQHTYFIPHSTDSDTGQDRLPLFYSKLHVSMTRLVKLSVAKLTDYILDILWGQLIKLTQVAST